MLLIQLLLIILSILWFDNKNLIIVLNLYYPLSETIIIYRIVENLVLTKVANLNFCLFTLLYTIAAAIVWRNLT